MENSKIMDSQTLNRTLMRISHEILERNKDLTNVVIIGIQRRGTFLADRIQKNILEIEKIKIPVGYLDITFHRDDLGKKGGKVKAQKTEIFFDLNKKIVILVDDVIFSGRSIRAAIDEIMDFGRPQRIQLAVLIDRGHRELPIRPDYVGKNVPTSQNEEIQLFLTEVDGKDEVLLIEGKKD